MSGRGDEDGAIVAFARAFARVTDPFGERGRVLADLGMDEARWNALETRWLGELARRERGGDGAFAELFRKAFGEARAALAAERQRSSAPVAVSPQQAPVQCAVATTVPGMPALVPALPFKGSRPVPPPELDIQEHKTGIDVNSTGLLEEAPVVDPLPFKPRNER